MTPGQTQEEKKKKRPLKTYVAQGQTQEKVHQRLRRKPDGQARREQKQVSLFRSAISGKEDLS